MDDHVYKSIEITGTSEIDLENAIKNAIKRASKSIDNLRWFEVIDKRGSIKNGEIDRWQVTIKVGFKMKD